jgi:hypothetical protein
VYRFPLRDCRVAPAPVPYGLFSASAVVGHYTPVHIFVMGVDDLLSSVKDDLVLPFRINRELKRRAVHFCVTSFSVLFDWQVALPASLSNGFYAVNARR